MKDLFCTPELADWVIARLEEAKSGEENKEIQPAIGKPVTKWYVWNDELLQFKYNHYEEGHCESGTPKTDDMEIARIWAKSDWLGKHAIMVDGAII